MPLAAVRAGLVNVPVNRLLKRAQVAHILGDSGARLLIANAGRLAMLGPGDLADAAALVESAVWAAADVMEPLGPSAAAADALAAILYTSGSTGRPKGVMLSNANLWPGAVSVAHYLGVGERDRLLAVLLLAFVSGQSQLLSTWLHGTAAVPPAFPLVRPVRQAVAHLSVTTITRLTPPWSSAASDGLRGQAPTGPPAHPGWTAPTPTRCPRGTNEPQGGPSAAAPAAT